MLLFIIIILFFSCFPFFVEGPRRYLLNFFQKYLNCFDQLIIVEVKGVIIVVVVVAIIDASKGRCG